MRPIKTTSTTDIVNRIDKLCEKKRILPVELSRRLGVTASTIYLFRRSKNCDVDRLWDICKVLDYNFFRELSEEVDIAEPTNTVIEKLQNEIIEKDREIDKLKDVIRIISGR